MTGDDKFKVASAVFITIIRDFQITSIDKLLHSLHAFLVFCDDLIVLRRKFVRIENALRVVKRLIDLLLVPIKHLFE